MNAPFHHTPETSPGTTMAGHNRRVGAWLMAMALATRSKLGEPDDDTMRHAALMIPQVFEADDPLSVEVASMSRQWRELRAPHRADLLREAGDRLLTALVRSSWPRHTGRADLDG